MKIFELAKDIRLLRVINLLDLTYNSNTEYLLNFNTILQNNEDIDILTNNVFFIKKSNTFDIRLSLNFNTQLQQQVILFACLSDDNINYNLIPNSLREFNFERKSGNLIGYNNIYPISENKYLKFFIKSKLNEIEIKSIIETTSFGNVTMPNTILNIRSLLI